LNSAHCLDALCRTLTLDQAELMRVLAEAYYQLESFEQAYLTLKAANKVKLH